MNWHKRPAWRIDTIRGKYTPGQPRGAKLSDTQPHSIDIGRGAAQPHFTSGQVSSCFVLRKNGDGGYTEVKTSSGGQRLSDGSVAELKKTLTTLEDLLLCPVEVEFAIDHRGHLFAVKENCHAGTETPRREKSFFSVSP